MRRDITELQIKPGEGTLVVGSTLQLNLFSLVVGGGTGLVPANMATWTTSNPAVAEISRQGRLTARKPGTVSITASYADKVARAEFTTVAAQA
jgi:uncharacterized protein YjdB